MGKMWIRIQVTANASSNHMCQPRWLNLHSVYLNINPNTLYIPHAMDRSTLKHIHPT